MPQLRNSPTNLSLITFAIAMIGASCGSFAPVSTDTPPQRLPSNTAAPPTPTHKGTASLTPTETLSPTLIPTSTGTPIQLPSFSGASVLGVSLLDGRRLMVSVTVPQDIVGDYRATVRGQEFECFVLPEYPDRLYCIGPEPKRGDEALLEIFQAEADEPQFEAVFAIPQRPSESGGAGAATAIVQFGGALGNNYSPSNVTINVGDMVEWRGDFSVHPLVSDGGQWGTVSGSSAFSFTFNSPGTYTYHCQVHQALGMTGEVIVLAP